MAIHVVSPGDTVWSIARQYGVSPQRILSDNGILNPQALPSGQALLILIPSVLYTVRPGDTLSSISSKFAIPQLTLLQNNPSLINSPYLQVGQTIVIAFEEEKQRRITVNGYAYPYIREDILRRALPYLTYLTIFGYGFTPDGALIPINDEPLIRMAYEYRTAPVMLLSSVTEDGNFSGERASLLFQNQALQETVMDNILALMHKKGYVGLDVDFEYVEQKDATAFLGFLEYTASRLHAEGFFLHTDLAPKTSAAQAGLLYEAHNYEEIGRISDTVLLMTYEWQSLAHWLNPLHSKDFGPKRADYFDRKPLNASGKSEKVKSTILRSIQRSISTSACMSRSPRTAATPRCSHTRADLFGMAFGLLEKNTAGHISCKDNSHRGPNEKPAPRFPIREAQGGFSDPSNFRRQLGLHPFTGSAVS